jgi:hypothetical protein
MANRKNLLRAMEAFIKQVGLFHNRLKRSDEKQILALFQEAQMRRDFWKAGSSLDSPG